MAWYPHREQASTWAPSRGVRQRRMAVSTLMCSQLSHPRLCSKNAEPAARITSATSSGGRGIYFVCGPLPDLSNSESESSGLAVACKCRLDRWR